jgi:hypothetical protein
MHSQLNTQVDPDLAAYLMGVIRQSVRGYAYAVSRIAGLTARPDPFYEAQKIMLHVRILHTYYNVNIVLIYSGHPIKT